MKLKFWQKRLIALIWMVGGVLLGIALMLLSDRSTFHLTLFKWLGLGIAGLGLIFDCAAARCPICRRHIPTGLWLAEYCPYCGAELEE